MPLILPFLPVYPYKLGKNITNTVTKYACHVIQLQAGKCELHSGHRAVP